MSCCIYDCDFDDLVIFAFFYFYPYIAQDYLYKVFSIPFEGKLIIDGINSCWLFCPSFYVSFSIVFGLNSSHIGHVNQETSGVVGKDVKDVIPVVKFPSSENLYTLGKCFWTKR